MILGHTIKQEPRVAKLWVRAQTRLLQVAKGIFAKISWQLAAISQKRTPID
jgi:hypothetical protein